MSTPEDSPPGGEARLEAAASESARIYQAARDQYVTERDLHLHYATGVRRARRALGGGVADAECPYPGLAAFGEMQSRWFFGRDAVTADLLVLLDERLRDGGALAVVAPSGAGKSSLLRAGLLPAVARGALPAPGSAYWPRLFLTPTAHPMTELSARLAQALEITQVLGLSPQSAGRGEHAYTAAVLAALAAGGRPERRLVLVVDQLEELFTLCGSEGERRDFLDVLTALARPQPAGGGPAALVVLGLRSDFYTPCVDYPQLRSALQGGQLVVGSMMQEELREAIIFPAQDVGLELEPGLVEVLLRDLGAHPGDGRLLGAERPEGYEAGRLPLLAHALRVTWQQRHEHLLTLDGYQSTGGIRNAVTTTAERIFTGLDPDAQRIARTLFLRLVKIGDGVEDMRRRLPHADLLDTSPDPGAASAVIAAFTNARLLTQHHDTVEITHEALLQAWPRLRAWIEDDRSGHLVHQSLEEAATAWRAAGHDTGMLYRGGRLETARTWANRAHEVQVSPVASAFLGASVQHSQRGARIRRAAIAILTTLALLATTAAVLALQQRSSARAQRDEAVSSQVKAEGGGLRASEASLAAQLNVAALRMRPQDADLRTRLIEDASQPLSQPLSGGNGPFNAVDFSGDGKLLAVGSNDGSVQLWRFAGSSEVKWLGRLKNGSARARVVSVATASNGRLLATAVGEGPDLLFDIADPTNPRRLGQLPLEAQDGSGALKVAVSPDGQLMASASLRHSWANVWDTSDPRHPQLLARASNASSDDIVRSVAFSSTGRYLAAMGEDGNVQLWDLTYPVTPIQLGQITGMPHNPAAGRAIGTAVFSPDDKTLATGADDGVVRLWNIADKRHPRLLGLPLPNHLSPIADIAFSTDGRTLATSSTNQTVCLWNLANLTDVPLQHVLHGHLLGNPALAFRPNDNSLVTVAADPAPLWWHLRPTVLNRHQGRVLSETFGRDDRTVITTGNDGAICRWSIRRVSHPVLLACGSFENTPRGSFHDNRSRAVTVSPNGRTMALANRDTFSVELWDIADLRHPKKLGTLSKEAFSTVLAFSPDSRVLVVGSHSPWLWDVSDPRHARPLHRIPQNDKGAWVDGLAFSSDGRLLAALDAAVGRVTLWNMRDPGHPTQAGDTKNTWPRRAAYSLAMDFSSKGNLVATASNDGRIRLWSASRSGALSPKGTTAAIPTGFFTSLSFSPDGSLLATGGSDKAIRLWDVSDPEHPSPFGLPLTGHTRDIDTVVFSPTAPVLVSDSTDGTIRLWPTETSYDTYLVCTASAGTLTPDQWKRHLSGLPYDPPCPEPIP